MCRLLHHHFTGVQVGSPIHPYWVILKLSGQTGCPSCYIGAYSPLSVVEIPFLLWRWLFSQRFVIIHITRSRDVYSHWWSQSRWCLPRWAFSKARPQRFDCPTIYDSSVDWDRSSYLDGLFSCDSLVDHSFDTTMDSPSRASWVRGIRIVMTLHQASYFSQMGYETMFIVDFTISTC